MIILMMDDERGTTNSCEDRILGLGVLSESSGQVHNQNCSVGRELFHIFGFYADGFLPDSNFDVKRTI